MHRFPFFAFLCTVLSAQTPLFDLTKPATAAPPQSLVAADFNSDGKPDLAVTEGGSLEILLGNGDGTFLSARVISLGAPATRIAAADFNRDGKSDLAVSVGSDGHVTVLLGNGDGSFQSPSDVGVQNPAGQVAGAGVPGLTVGDVNGDGKPDLILGPYSLTDSSTVVVLLGNGNGSFQRPASTTLNRVDAVRVVVGDFNSDGRADIFITGLTPGRLQEFGLLSGNADGSLTVAHWTIGVGTADNDGYPVVARDLNGNGKTDILFVTGAGDGPNSRVLRLSEYLDGSSQLVSSTVTVPIGSSPVYLESMTAADVNGDGKSDLLLTDSLGEMYVLYGVGDGSFQSPAPFPPPVVFAGGAQDFLQLFFDTFGSITTADFRGTGRPDIALAIAGKSVSLLNTGSGSSPAVLPTGLVNPATLSNSPAVAGSLITIFGDRLAYDSGTPPPLWQPQTLFGLAVDVDSARAGILYASPRQANIQIPWEAAGQAQASFIVSRNGALRNVTIPLAPYAPGLFTLNEQGTGQAAAIIAGTTGAIPAPAGAYAGSRPVHRGESVALYGTGLGAVETAGKPPLVTGAATPGPGPYTPGDPLYRTPVLPYVNVGGVSASVQFSGLAPFLVALYQVNIQIPPNAPTGDAVPVYLYIGGVPSNTVTIAIQ